MGFVAVEFIIDMLEDFIVGNLRWFHVDIDIEDPMLEFEQIFHLFGDFMAFIDRQVRVHFEDKIQINIGTVGPSSLGFDGNNLGKFEDVFLIEVKQFFIKAI